MKRRACLSLGLIVSAGALAPSATGAPAAGADLGLTPSQKLKLIQKSIKSVTGLAAAVRLSARKTYVAGQADITIREAPRVDPVRDEINLHQTGAGEMTHRIDLRFKPRKAGQPVLIDVAVRSSTAGPAKVVLAQPGGQRSELVLAQRDDVGHVTLVARPSNTEWQTFMIGVTQGNVMIKHVEATPAA